MYCCKFCYDYDQLRDISNWIKKLYINSCCYYDDYVFDNKSILKREVDLIKIQELVGYVEDYVRGLIDLGYINNNGNGSILRRLMRLEVVGLLECNDVFVTGVNDNNKLFINFNLNKSDKFTGEERRRFRVCKQMTKFLHNDWNKDITDYNACLKVNGEDCLDEFFITRGFNLLDEAISQDVAENIMYYISRRERPFKMYSPEQSILDGVLYKSKFDEAANVLDSAIKFGRTLKCVGSNQYDSDGDILKKMSIRSFNQGFVQSIVGQYQKDVYQQKDLYDMLFSMGKILEARSCLDSGRLEDKSIYFSPCYLISLEQMCDKYKVDSYEKRFVKV